MAQDVIYTGECSVCTWEKSEINEKETKETAAKTNKIKSWFFDKINKIDKPLARLIKKKKGEESNQQN